MNRSEPSPVHEWNNYVKNANRQFNYTRAPDAQNTAEMMNAVPITAEPRNAGEDDILSSKNTTQPTQES